MSSVFNFTKERIEQLESFKRWWVKQHQSDPDFVTDPKIFTVKLDVIVQKHCIVADSDKGLVLRYKTNKLGMFQKARNGKQFLTEQINGVVEITVPK